MKSNTELYDFIIKYGPFLKDLLKREEIYLDLNSLISFKALTPNLWERKYIASGITKTEGRYLVFQTLQYGNKDYNQVYAKDLSINKVCNYFAVKIEKYGSL